MRRLTRYLPFILLLVLCLALPISHVLAEDTWCYEYNFSLDNGGFVAIAPITSVVYGTYSAPYWGNVYNTVGITGNSELRLWKTAPTSGHFTYISLTYSTSGAFDTLDAFSFAVSLTPSSGSHVVSTADIDVTTDDLRIDFYKAGPGAETTMRLEKIKYRGDGTSPFGASNCDDFGGGGTLTRPLTSTDETETFPLYDESVIGELATTNLQDYQIYPALNNGGTETVSAWSKSPGAQVHAADAGSIVDMKPLAASDCGLAFVSPSTLDPEETPTVFLTQLPADQTQPCLIRRFEISTGGGLPDYGDIAKDEYWLDATGAYLVTIQIGTGQKIQYLVKNAPNYVVIGDSVDVGCVLGETLGITTSATSAINFPGIAGAIVQIGVSFVAPQFSVAAAALTGGTGLNGPFVRSFPATASPLGYTSMTLFDVDDSRLELASQLTVEPTNQDKCNNTGEYRDCLAFNPQFARQGDGWIASGNVEWTEPGVILDPGESVSATINLSSTGDYTATAYAQGVNGAASEIRLFLGSHTDRYAAPLEWTSLQLAAEPLGAPDAGTFYTVGVQNTGTSPVEIRSLCVTDGAPNTGPNSCYFNNQSFVNGISGWTVSEGVTPVDQALNVPDNGIISQNVLLKPFSDGPATYKLVVRGNWWYTGTIEEATSASAVASVKYEWPDGTGYQDMTPINITGNLAYGLGELAYMAEIVVTDNTDDLMNIKVETTTAGDMDVQGIQITDACLSTKNGGPFPQQGGSGAPPPIEANCTYVSRPQNNDPAAWLQWHWAKSEQFYRCDLMVLLNKMYTLGKQSYLLAGWQARYGQSQLRLWSSWLGAQFFPWLGGHFRNIAIGQVTTVYSGSGQCSDLFCVLQTLINGLLTPLNNIVTALLGILGGVTGILFSVINGLLTLIVALIAQILGLLQLAQQLLATLITAYNSATPVSIPGLPSCSLDPRSSAFCMGIWVLDNTIFSGTGAAIIPMLVGILSIHLLIWVVGEIKRTVITAGSVA